MSRFFYILLTIFSFFSAAHVYSAAPKTSMIWPDTLTELDNLVFQQPSLHKVFQSIPGLAPNIWASIEERALQLQDYLDENSLSLVITYEDSRPIAIFLIDNDSPYFHIVFFVGLSNTDDATGVLQEMINLARQDERRFRLSTDAVFGKKPCLGDTTGRWRELSESESGLVKGCY